MAKDAEELKIILDMAANGGKMQPQMPQGQVSDMLCLMEEGWDLPKCFPIFKLCHHWCQN